MIASCTGTDGLAPLHPGPGHDPLEDWHIQRKEAQIVRAMVGLLRLAASPRYVDLSDHPNLARAIRTLCLEFEEKRRLD
ncbi:hypothetical protein SUDANB99_05942 (plasmid) [Streptomyces sp. enrichment culture]